MGGVPVLLKLIALMGITYGWQPDNNGGVEYIIQVSADDLKEIERLGEITSAINPTVQGYVSRVVVRVGNGPLPRKTPENLRRQLPSQAANDYSSIPIPEMVDTERAIPIPSLASANSDRQAAVMKPQSDGFKLPQGGASLRQAGKDLLDRGTENLSAAAQQAGNRLRNALGSDQTQPTAPSLQTPPFTGSDPTGSLARTRQGGPSTEPTPRDNSWQEFAGPRRGGPSTTPVSNPNEVANNSSRRTQATNGVGPNDTFGKLPAGLNFPNTARSNTTDRQTNVPGGIFSQAEQTAYDLQLQQQRAAYEKSQQLAKSTAASKLNAPQQQQQTIDNRLTAAQIAAGAVAFDQYFRPIDRYNRLVKVEAPTPSPTYTTNTPNTPADRTYSSLGSPNPGIQSLAPQFARQNTPTNFNSSQSQFQQNPPVYQQPNTLGSNQFNPNRVAVAAPNINQQQQAPFTPQPTLTQASNPTTRQLPSQQNGDYRRSQASLDPPSLSDRRSEASLVQPKRYAAQPFLNSLLLISFVTNIYLAFWMRNLRVRFHDLVAARRMANSSNAAA